MEEGGRKTRRWRRGAWFSSPAGNVWFKPNKSLFYGICGSRKISECKQQHGQPVSDDLLFIFLKLILEEKREMLRPLLMFRFVGFLEQIKRS